MSFMCGNAAASNSSTRGFLEKSIQFGRLTLKLIIPDAYPNIPLCGMFFLDSRRNADIRRMAVAPIWRVNGQLAAIAALRTGKDYSPELEIAQEEGRPFT